MTIDERIEKLVARHEALTQTVELMAAEGQRLQRLNESHERRITLHDEELIRLREERIRLDEQIARLESRSDAEQRGRLLDERIDKLVSAIGRLAGKEPHHP